MIDIKSKKDCCGCNACAERCPRNCITMQMDNEGFFYPFVDETRCVQCNLCEKVCPIINQNEPVLPTLIYAAKNKDKVVVHSSSSGGIFTAIAENIIRKRKGVVFGAIFDDKWNVVMSYTETVDGLIAMQGSKYVQSDIRDCYTKAEQFLKQGRAVLFSGTPCQISGLKSFLHKEYNSLYAISIICHGVPSPGIWRDYKNNLSSRLATDRNKASLSVESLPVITDINFRDKTNGWQEYGFSVKGSSSVKETGVSVNPPKNYCLFEHHHENLYMRGFLNNLYLRPSCHHCPSRKGKSGADIQLGDYWGVQRSTPDFYDPDGVSLVLLYTDKGINLFKELDILSTIVSYESVLDCNDNVENDEREPVLREKFFSLYNKRGLKAIGFFCDKLEHRTLLVKIKRKIGTLIRTIK